MNFAADSIRARLLAAAALWLTLALLVAWWAISSLLAGFVIDRFDAEAAAIAETVIAGTEIAEDGRVTLLRAPTDARLAQPLSLWAWQLQDGSGRVLARAPSLLDLYLSPPAGAFVGEAGIGPDGEPLRVMRRLFTLPGNDAPLAVTVTAPRAEIDSAIARIRRPLAAALIILGAGLAAASVAQVALGLRALDRMGGDIRRIRAGHTESLPLPAVSELRPIAVELNDLLDANRSVLGRARDHLGNLAHSLKTPMAALANSLPPDHAGQALIARMDRQIGWHLRRARSAGTPRLLGQSTAVRAVIDDILMVLNRPITDRGLHIVIDCPPEARFAGDRHDLEEMLGNIFENAVKYAKSRIVITVDLHPARVAISVADDGVGMAEADHEIALSRGGRLDEAATPGAGLGLAIVADLSALHGGAFQLGRAEIGGLMARLSLPA